MKGTKELNTKCHCKMKNFSKNKSTKLFSQHSANKLTVFSRPTFVNFKELEKNKKPIKNKQLKQILQFRNLEKHLTKAKDCLGKITRKILRGTVMQNV